MQAPELGGLVVEKSYYPGREHPGVMTAAKSRGEGTRKWRAARDRRLKFLEDFIYLF